MSKKSVYIFTEEYGRTTEVWIHRQITGLPDWICGVAAKGFLNPDTFPVPHRINLGWKSIWQHRLSHIIWSCRYFRWVSDDEMDVLRAASRLKKAGCRLLHCHFLWNAPIALAVAQRLKIPLLVTAHGTDVNQARVDVKYRDKLKQVFEGVTYVLAVSHFIGRILKEVGCPEEKILVSHLGTPIPTNIAPRKNGIFRWICVAGLRQVKGHKYLIQAFSKAVRENSQMELFIVGDGELRESLEELSSKLKMNDFIHFTGSQTPEQVSELLLTCHGGVLSSIVEKRKGVMKEEAISISLVEAAAFGLPLVATDCGGIPEICHDGYNGILVPSEDIDALSNAILKIAGSPDLATEMSMNSRKLAESEYDINDSLHELGNLYESLIVT